MKFDELYKKVIDASRAFEKRHVPISLDFKIEDLRDALVESNDTIEELKQKLESVQNSMYCDVVDANMENRKLRRALWIARAERAVAKQAYYDVLSRGISSERCEMYDVWNKVERKCRAKAEEYK